MWRRHGVLWSAVLAAGVLGCGKSDGPAEQGGRSAARPTAGNRQQRQRPARQRTTRRPPSLNSWKPCGPETMSGPTECSVPRHARRCRSLAPALPRLPAIPPDSSSAKSTTSPTTAPGSSCTWTDLDESGKPESRRSLWVVRHEDEGWRVVGVAATVFEGEPPLLLNFEDPEDVLKKQQWLRAEVARRSQEEKNHEKAGETPGDTIRR